MSIPPLSPAAAALRVQVIAAVETDLIAALDAAQGQQAPAARTAPQASPIKQAVDVARADAAGRQASLAPLFADLAQAQASPALPIAVKAALGKLLALQTPLGGLVTAETVKRAIAQSGLFLEAHLAASEQATKAETPDLKAALLTLQRALAATPTPTVAAKPAGPTTPPPAQDTALAVQPPAPATPTVAAKSAAPTTPPPAHDAALAAQPPAPATLTVAAKSAAPITPPPAHDAALAGQPLAPATPTVPAKPAAPTMPPPAHDAALAAQPPAPATPTVAVKSAGPTTPRPAQDAALAAQPPAPATPTVAVKSAAPTTPPPAHDAALAGQPPAHSTLSAGDGAPAIVQHLLREVDGAVARQVLHQLASVPDGATTAWMFELPIATPQGTALAQFEIDRDGAGPDANDPTQAWRVRFSIDIEPLGPVHIHLGMTGDRAAVTVWAEREDGLERLRSHGAELSRALPAEVIFHPGAPRRPVPAKGRFVDQSS